jgi:hypothetical protein
MQVTHSSLQCTLKRRTFTFAPTGFGGRGVPCLLETSLDWIELDRANTCVILDGVNPNHGEVTHVPTVFIASQHLAKQCLTNVFCQGVPGELEVRTYTFPCFDDKELKRMHAVGFPDLPEKDVNERMAFWGPIPRWVLGSSVFQQQQRLEHLLSFRYKHIDELLSPHDTETYKARDHIFSMHARGEQKTDLNSKQEEFYYPGILSFASPAIAFHVIKQVHVGNVRECLHRLCLQLELKLGPFFPGRVYTSIATFVLATGKSFAVRKLPDTTKDKPEEDNPLLGDLGKRKQVLKQIPQASLKPARDDTLPLLEFASLEDLQQRAAEVRQSAPKGLRVFRAGVPDECGIDGVIWHDGTFFMYNISFAEPHGLKLRSSNGKGGLWPAVKALGIDKDDEVHVIFVTYERYDNQYTTAQELQDEFKAPVTPPGNPPVNVDKGEVEAFKGKVTQYCLSMPENIVSISYDETRWDRTQSWLAAHADEKLLKDSRKPMSVEAFSAYLSKAEKGDSQPKPSS